MEGQTCDHNKKKRDKDKIMNMSKHRRIKMSNTDHYQKLRVNTGALES